VKLAKAIEIMELNLEGAGRHMPADVKDALKLHIEAAKLIQRLRMIPDFGIEKLLPGETQNEQLELQ